MGTQANPIGTRKQLALMGSPTHLAPLQHSGPHQLLSLPLLAALQPQHAQTPAKGIAFVTAECQKTTGMRNQSLCKLGGLITFHGAKTVCSTA